MSNGLHGSLTKEYANRLLTEAREELTRADAKASTIFAGAGVTVAVAVGAAAEAGVDVTELPRVVQVLLVVAGAAQLAGLAFLAYAVAPRTAVGQPGRLHYFADVGANPRETLRALADKEATDPVERDLQQLVAINGILERKYGGVRRGLIWSGIAAVLCVLASVAAVLG